MARCSEPPIHHGPHAEGDRAFYAGCCPDSGRAGLPSDLLVAATRRVPTRREVLVTGLLSNFDLALRLAGAVGILAVVTAGFAAHRAPAHERFRRAVRVLAVGAILSVAAATVVTPGGITWNYHQLVLVPGQGGLGDLAKLANEPDSLAAVQLVLNVALYVPVGLLVTMGWDGNSRGVRRGLIVGACTAVCVEFVQWQFTTRVASTDDVLLNLIGVGLGVSLAAAVRRRRPDSKPYKDYEHTGSG